MHLQQRILFHGTRDLVLDTADPNFAMFIALVGYNTDVDYVLLSENGNQFESGVGRIGAGGGFERALIKGSTTELKVAFNSGRNILLLSSRAETIAYKTTDQLALGTSYADVTETGLWVAAKTAYDFEFRLIMDADATTTAIYAGVNGPASYAALSYTVTSWAASGASFESFATDYDFGLSHTNSNGADAAIYVVRGTFQSNDEGTLIARACREAVGSGPNVRAGSFGRLQRISGPG